MQSTVGSERQKVGLRRRNVSDGWPRLLVAAGHDPRGFPSWVVVTVQSSWTLPCPFKMFEPLT